MGIQDSRDQNQVSKSRHLSMISGYLHIANAWSPCCVSARRAAVVYITSPLINRDSCLVWFCNSAQ